MYFTQYIQIFQPVISIKIEVFCILLFILNLRLVGEGKPACLLEPEACTDAQTGTFLWGHNVPASFQAHSCGDSTGTKAPLRGGVEMLECLLLRRDCKWKVSATVDSQAQLIW